MMSSHSSRDALRVLCLVLAGAACARGPRAPSTSPAAATRVYTCAGDYRFVARPRGDSLELTLPSGQVTLAPVRAASGARYEGGGVAFWSKGNEATLTETTGERAGCEGEVAATRWDEARLLGADFRAIGQEPGWTLELGRLRGFRLTLAGAEPIVAQLPERQEDPRTDTDSYQVSAGGHDVAVAIARETCRDAMSGERMMHAVTVRLDGRELRGCGRRLDVLPIAERQWKLIELAGRQSVAGTGPSEAHIRLTSDGRVTGSSGCNNFRGSYALEDDRLNIFGLVSTRMACLDRALADQERVLLAALPRTARVVLAANTLTLYSGSTPLARFIAVDTP